MPTLLTEVPIESLQRFLDRIEHYMHDSNHALWYRGCGKASHPLVPSLYRHPTIANIDRLLTLEHQLLTSFRARSVPYLAEPPTNDLELLFLMQHYGVPTRLLDWTENPFLALFFALSDASKGEGEIADDAAVWVLDPKAWNTKSLTQFSHTEEMGILSTTDNKLKGYLPRTELELMTNAPVALYGIHNSRRIVAQKGVFILFGKSQLAMKDLYEQNTYPGDGLVKFIIPRQKIPDLLRDLIGIGITDSVLYPDLDGLAREIKRSAGFRT